MSICDKKIVVVGAGIGGLAAALALRQRGADVTVLEQAAAISEVGAGLQISPNGVAVLNALGLADALSAAAVRAHAVSLRDYRRPGEVLRLDLGTYAPDLNYCFLHRADLVSLLADAVRASGVPIRLLQQVDSADLNRPATLHMSNGSRVRADLVVGADGLHSRLRSQLNRSDQPFFTGQVAWRATVPNSIDLPPEAQLYMGPGRHLVCYPLRDGCLVNIVAVQERKNWTAEGWHHQDRPENLRRAFADFRGIPSALLDQVSEVNLWGLFRHKVAQHWHGPNAALLGDAAHPTLPFLAQGANMALEDAWVLGAELARADSIESGLARYQARRHARATRVIAAASGNAWKYHLRFPPLRGAAHLALRLSGRVAPARMVGQFDWLYRHDVTQEPAA
ncbi:FAD-dependent monooxygenase [Ruegeria sp. 2012CJ41-6]|uniref:FAD-dependent monooxygenase n=1 Tax=Ruegeria spongiae TaxID=2942209 RepID=A0ABT0PZP4_9RHOB|nr:FAD-dependent monooxygenase [Ruegeria spongiae]MCL6283023.1 FAD-dependent monooxygenase [Ruegeria spongiae]